MSVVVCSRSDSRFTWSPMIHAGEVWFWQFGMVDTPGKTNMTKSKQGHIDIVLVRIDVYRHWWECMKMLQWWLPSQLLPPKQHLCQVWDAHHVYPVASSANKNINNLWFLAINGQKCCNGYINKIIVETYGTTLLRDFLNWERFPPMKTVYHRQSQTHHVDDFGKRPDTERWDWSSGWPIIKMRI